MNAVINNRVDTVSAKVIDGYKEIAALHTEPAGSVGDIGHILESSSFMDTGIRPVYKNVKLIGPAITAKMLPGDNSLGRKLIEFTEPGDVIVIDASGDIRYAFWGGALALCCKVRGVAGLIGDGAVTDSMEIADMQWPVFSRGFSGLVGRRLDKGGGINIPIQCGGAVVFPGDLIVADDDGIAVIKPEEAEELLQKLYDRFRPTPSIRKWIADGNPLENHPNANLLQKK